MRLLEVFAVHPTSRGGSRTDLWSPEAAGVPLPHDGALSFEALVELRVRDLRERYEQEVILYTCRAKDIGTLSQAESIEDAAEQVVLSVGGNVTLVPSVVRLLHEMETKSATDRVGEVAVFTLCQASVDRFRTSRRLMTWLVYLSRSPRGALS